MTKIFLKPIIFPPAIGTKNDKFVRCPEAALDWRTRRFRMLEEIVRHDPDIVCLQEVDHFKFLRKSLSSLGYMGHFLPKPDSPCLYLADNSGPDGCAIFYKQDKFDMLTLDKRIVEVWRVQMCMGCVEVWMCGGAGERKRGGPGPRRSASPAHCLLKGWAPTPWHEPAGHDTSTGKRGVDGEGGEGLLQV